MDANTIIIYPNVAAKTREYQEMIVRTFFLANADAKLVSNTLKTILKTRDVVVDEKLNLLIVRDSPEAIRLAERLINLQDVAEPEVMLDVEVLEIQRNRLLELGIAWPTSVTLSPLTTSGGAAVTLADLDHLNRNTLGISSLSAKLTANKTDGDSNLLANPRIRVRNKEKAKILIGDKVPVITSTVSSGVGGFLSDSVNYIDVGLTLNAEPTIYLNNDVGIRIALEVSSISDTVKSQNGTTAYRIGTRQASTFLQLKDGENQVLAGLINSEDRSAGSKIPGVGDMPVLGRLFGSGTDTNNKTEIVLSITPHILRNVQRPEAASAEFSTGTEGNFRRRPDLAPRGAAQLPDRSGGMASPANGGVASPLSGGVASPVSGAGAGGPLPGGGQVMSAQGATNRAPQAESLTPPPVAAPVSPVPAGAVLFQPVEAPPASAQPPAPPAAPLPVGGSMPMSSGQPAPAQSSPPPASSSVGN